jgi:hypothetical protein
MGLLSRSKEPKAPRAPRSAPPPRVRLRPEEIKASNRLSARDRKIGYAGAAYAAAMFAAVGVYQGFSKGEAASMSLGIGLAVGMVVLAWKFSSRIGLSLGAVACVMWLSTKWPTLSLAAYPLLGFMLYLMLAMSNDRRKTIKRRIEDGDLADPRSESRATREARAAAGTSSATSVDGRPAAPPSKRYTPPKPVKPKR